VFMTYTNYCHAESYSSALEIITKFSDPEFVRKAKVADFTVQAWQVLREAGAGDGDKVCVSSYLI
jgi:uncharacterized protein HemY